VPPHLIPRSRPPIKEHFVMGSAVTSLPNTIDEETCRKICGDKFNQAEFDSLKSTSGSITKEQLTKAMGCVSSATATATAALLVKAFKPSCANLFTFATYLVPI
jgi:hypothetical protein